MKERSPLLVIILGILTLGIYLIYWFYDVNKQFKEELGDGSSPGLRTLGLFVPIVNLVVIYKFAKSSEEATGGYSWLLIFLAFLVFSPVAWFVVQSDINSAIE